MKKLHRSQIEPLEYRIAPAFAAAIDVSNLAGDGFRINGVFPHDYAGSSVSDAGDVNGDGIDDFIIGAPGSETGRIGNDTPSTGIDTGGCYVVFGKAGGFAPVLDASSLNGTNGFRIVGGARDGAMGSSVSAAGDVNGDGFDDLIIGAPGTEHLSQSSAIYVVFGKASGFTATLNVSTLNGANGLKLAAKLSPRSARLSVARGM